MVLMDLMVTKKRESVGQIRYNFTKKKRLVIVQVVGSRPTDAREIAVQAEDVHDSQWNLSDLSARHPLRG
jgi:tRNA-dihydrouridine synthase